MFSFRSQRSRQILATLGAATVALTTAAGAAGAATTPFALVVSGSTTVCPIAQALVSGYQTTYTDTTIVGPTGTTTANGGVDCPGSGTGIKNILSGTSDVADASRPMKSTDNFTGAAFNTSQMDQWVVGLDGIAIIVNNNPAGSVPNDITSLTVSQIKGIYACTFTNWNQVGSATSAAIVPYQRTNASGTFGDFNTFVGLPTTGGGTCAATPSQGDSNPGLLAGTQGTPGSIAYVGSGFAYSNGVPAANIRILKVDGALPTSTTVDSAIKALVCAPVAPHTTCDAAAGQPGSVFPFSQAPAPDTVGTCVDGNSCAGLVPPGAYPFGRQLFMDTIKYLQLPATGTRTTNIARAIQFVNSAVSGTGQQTVLNQGFFGLLTHNPTVDPSFSNACVTAANGSYCPQIIPPWDVQVEGVTNIDAVVNVGNFWQQTPPAGEVKGWIRADVVQAGIVNIDSVVKIGNHWQETWTRWTD